jgi:single-strand DNA-binding protein
MINQVVLIGRLVRDPELKYTSGSGIPVATFTLAIDRPFKNAEGEREADFVPIVTWRKLAENCAEYLKKGSLSAVTGRLQIRGYEDKEGVKRKIAEIVADNVRFLDSKKKTEGQPNLTNPDNWNGQEISGDDVPF